MDNLQQEIKVIQEQFPDYSTAEIIRELKVRGWHLEVDDRLCLGKSATTSWFQLIARSVVSSSSENGLLHHQFIPTGEFHVVKQALDQCVLERITSIANNYLSQSGRPPVVINQIDGFEYTFLRSVIYSFARSVLLSIGVDRQLLDLGDYSLLMNRCLLRRTYSRGQWLEEYRNKNNQHWHQDSNVLFGVHPMLTIWLPLQHGAGISRPGIELSSMDISEFSVHYGDSTPLIGDVAQAYGLPHHSETVPTIPYGSAVVFNGLTFHRTFVSDAMTGYRDALLLRLCRTCDRHLFPGDRSSDCFL